jgi:hypothetical protein
LILIAQLLLFPLTITIFAQFIICHLRTTSAIDDSKRAGLLWMFSVRDRPDWPLLIDTLFAGFRGQINAFECGDWKTAWN